jgi:chromosome segregation ATPase
MQFSGADVLVIGIVLIVLVLFRQLDRNNRSLDKVKRYADKVHDELEAHVQQKVVSIKDMGIELEVHQTAAKEVLRRVQAIEQSLNGRAEDIERIGTRISEYDSALDELVKMTERAEENINRVREESSYVDKVGKRIRQSQERLSQVESGLEQVNARFEQINEARLQSVVDTVTAEAAGQVDRIDAELQGFQERVNQFEEFVRGSEERGRAVAESADGQMQEILQTVINRAQEATIQSSEQISELRGQLETLEADYQKRLLSLAERGEKMETEALAKLREQIESSGQDVRRELASRLDSHKRTFLEHVQATLRSMEESEQALATREQRLEASRQQLDARISTIRGELTKQIDMAIDEAQRSSLGAVETRLSDYESQMSYRIEQLGNVGEDIDQLEARLRDAMSQVRAGVQEEFDGFVAEFKRTRQLEERGFSKEMQGLRESMSELETGLTDLKNQAYENVNEKLQVFEDEFFADLKERQVSMEQRLVDWKGAFQQELDQLSAEGREERAKVESDYHGELEKQLARLQQQVRGQVERVEAETAEFQNGIELRVSDSRELIAALEREIEQEIQQLSADSRNELRDRFSEHREQMGSELKELDRSLRQQIEELNRRVGAEHTQMAALLENGRTDIADWAQQVDQRMKSTSDDVNRQIADFKVGMGETIAEMRETIREDQSSLAEGSAAERRRIETEIDELAAQVNRVTDDIRAKSAEALSEFGERYAELRLDTENHLKTMNGDVDARIKEFRSMVQDSRDQFAANQQRLLGKLNEEATALGANLKEIDRRQQAFVEQTRVFDRADELKEELGRQIGGLREDLNRVGQQRKEVQEMETQFSRLRKSAEDVGEKLQRFVGEKRRIDGLEEDYKKLLSMSHAVEMKLEHVTASNDSLQAMQVSLRQLEEMEKDVENRYQRLEKKRSILDMTTEGVDKNFESLQQIESKLGQITGELGEVPARVEELNTRLSQLAHNKRDADAAMKQLALLDQTLEDVEGRMEQLNQAREWLARTETRLEEVQQSAEEQVKLLGAILKQEKGGKKGEGAPAMTTRDTVIKLARQSWNVDEIARATSLSRGEVELILELSAK